MASPTLNRGSLVATLAIRLFLATVALTVALLLLIYWQLAAEVDNVRDRSLTSQAADIARHIKRDPNGTLSLDLPKALAEAYSDKDSGFYFQVREPSGAVVFASSDGAPILDDIHPVEGKTETFFLIVKPKAPRVHAANVVTKAVDRDLVIRVGQGESHSDVLLDEIIEDFLNHTGWGLPLILTIFLLVNIWTLRRSLAPIEKISSLAARIGPAKNIVLPETGLPSEIRPLVRAVNSAMGRLEEALSTQREFTADVAHELRTQLAVLNANLDTLDDAGSRNALKHDLSIMNRIVDQLLTIAQLNAIALDLNQRIDLGALATDVAARLGHLAIKRGRSISVTVPDDQVFVRGDRTVLQHGLTNLIENALSHAPLGTDVEIIVQSNGTIHVDDAGPGVPESEKKAVFQRYWRKTGSAGGAGIGLSIVAKIAETHQGKVGVSSSPRGGARFSLSVPLYEADGATAR